MTVSKAVLLVTFPVNFVDAVVLIALRSVVLVKSITDPGLEALVLITSTTDSKAFAKEVLAESSGFEQIPNYYYCYCDVLVAFISTIGH